jgi:hypothetical protein
VPVVASYHFVSAPLVAVAALGLVLLLCRWVFSTSERDARAERRLAAARRAGDYGLLVPVARVRTAEDADLLREVLHEAGVRATVSVEPAGQVVLVFRADADRARSLVASEPA